MFQARRDKDHTGFCNLSYVKFKTVFHTFLEEKKCDYNVQAFHSPPSTNTYFSPTFGCTWSLGCGPTSVWELPPSKIPGEKKTSLPMQPKGLSLGQVSGRMPPPLLSQPEEKPQMQGPALVPWKDLGVTQERRRKGGKLTLWALFSQNHKRWEQTPGYNTDWHSIRNMSIQVGLARKPGLHVS